MAILIRPENNVSCASSANLPETYKATCDHLGIELVVTRVRKEERAGYFWSGEFFIHRRGIRVAAHVPHYLVIEIDRLHWIGDQSTSNSRQKTIQRLMHNYDAAREMYQRTLSASARMGLPSNSPEFSRSSNLHPTMQEITASFNSKSVFHKPNGVATFGTGCLSMARAAEDNIDWLSGFDNSDPKKRPPYVLTAHPISDFMQWVVATHSEV